MGQRAHSQGEIKLAALQLQTATQAYDNQAKAFEHQVLRLTAADDELQALHATTTAASAATYAGSGFTSAHSGTASAFSVASTTRSQASTFVSAPGLSASAHRPSTPVARYVAIVEEDEGESEDETGLEAYGGVGPYGYGSASASSRHTSHGPRFGYISRSASSNVVPAVQVSGSGSYSSSSATGHAAASGSLLTVASGIRTTTTTTQRALDRDGYIIFEVVNVQVTERLTAAQVATWQQQWGQQFNSGMALVDFVPAVHPKEPSIILHIGLLREEVTCGQIRLLLAHLGFPLIQWVKRGYSTRNGPREDCAWAKFMTIGEAIQCKYRWDAISDWGLTPLDNRMGWPKELHFSFSTRPGYRGQRV